MKVAAAVAPPVVAEDCVDPALLLRTGARVLVVCVFVALFFCLLERSFANLTENFVYSETIGIAIFATYVALRRGRVRPNGGSSGKPFRASLAPGLIAVPIGFVAGQAIAALLLGQPLRLPSLGETSPFALGISAVTSVCVLYYFWTRGRLADAARVEADARRTTAEATLKLLQAQIEPHMLFNTLANLRTLVDVDPARAQTMIDQLIVYLRGTLSASRSQTTTLRVEFAQLEAYLSLMQVRMGSRLRYTFALPDDLALAPVPPMLLQPLVENAIKHGLEPKIPGGEVTITASVADGRLRIDVADDGNGLDGDAHSVSPAAAKDGGYGLEHVRERLRTLYGAAGSLSIDARPGGGVVARVEVPR